MAALEAFKAAHLHTLQLAKGDVVDFLVFTLFNTVSSAAPDSTASEDAGIEPKTVTTLALTGRRSNLE
jgi:hypothetical protein